jgi:predicted metal-dependent phosphoesterase TrpH
VRVLRADLHIHSCLSPCAELEMTPSAIVSQARERGLDLIAICDHNSTENVRAVSCCAEETDLAVIGGIEMTTREEVHMVGLFPDQHALDLVQEVVYEKLDGDNSPEFFGEQLVVDEHDQVIRHNSKLLIGATALSLEETVALIHRVAGIAIAAHIDRPSFSLISQIGFVPPELALDAVEVCSGELPPLAKRLPVVRSSDAHRLAEIGSRSTPLLVQEGTLPELRLAFRYAQGRRILHQ